jgi:prevent-host-death family protein
VEVNIHAAKTHLSRLLARVASGEEVTIAKAGVPIARLVPVAPSQNDCPLGVEKDSIWIAADFDAPARRSKPFLQGERRAARAKAALDELSTGHFHIHLESRAC